MAIQSCAIYVVGNRIFLRTCDETGGGIVEREADAAVLGRAVLDVLAQPPLADLY